MANEGFVDDFGDMSLENSAEEEACMKWKDHEKVIIEPCVELIKVCRMITHIDKVLS